MAGRVHSCVRRRDALGVAVFRRAHLNGTVLPRRVSTRWNARAGERHQWRKARSRTRYRRSRAKRRYIAAPGASRGKVAPVGAHDGSSSSPDNLPSLRDAGKGWGSVARVVTPSRAVVGLQLTDDGRARRAPPARRWGRAASETARDPWRTPDPESNPA